MFSQEILEDADHTKQFFIYSGVFLAFLGIAILEFIYVEKYTDGIPPQYLKNASIICKNLTQGKMFHYNTVAGIGFMFYLPAFYAMKAIKKHRTGTVRKQLWEEGDSCAHATMLEMILRIFLAFMCDFVSTHLIPTMIYGTRHVDMVPDFLYKRCLNVLF